MTERRRVLLGLVAVLLTPRLVLAQPYDRLIRIGWLGNSAPNSPQARAIADAFRGELRQRGWVEGRNLVIEFRYAEGVRDRFPTLAREMVELKVDLIVASSGTAAQAAKEATGKIPIVFASVPTPVQRGLVASLARPGGNLTGLATLSDELVGKRLELLKEAIPHIRRVAILGPPDMASNRDAELAGAKLNLQPLLSPAQDAQDLAGAIAAGAQADAWFIQDHPTYFANRKTIVELVSKQRKPAIYPHAIYVEDGGLMSYSVDLKDQFRRAAEMVDRILRGAKPADLPVELPTKFELVVNLKSAKALGLTIPPSLLVRADEVIQ